MADSLPIPYSRQEWQRAIFLFLACFVTEWLSLHFFPAASLIHPAAGIAVAGLFFAGPRLWPAVFAGFLFATVASGAALPAEYILPIALTLEAGAAAYLLYQAQIDPIFRRYRDTFYVTTGIVLAALIPPTILFLAHGTGYGTGNWFYDYVASTFSMIVVTPFLLRWMAKIKFRRPMSEAVETIGIFGVLLIINTALFMYGITEVYGISLVYLLIFPFFWIAIRLRPRFVTLGVLITSAFLIQSVLLSSPAGALVYDLYEAELFLIVLAIAFYIVMSLEEDRRLHTNIMRSQLAMLENAVSRISGESQAKNDFIAILAHELRNPLAPVVSSIELMKLKPNRDHDEAESLEVMDTSMQTVRRLLDDLLDISRISEGKVSIKREVLDVGHIIRRAVVSTGHHYKERHQTLAFSGSKVPLHVEGDPVRLEQVFSNLLTNASKYSPSGTTVTLTARAIDNLAEITFKDQGIGIPPDALNTIFLPFHQLEAGKQSKKGLGIGLALVHSFVNMHGGSVIAASTGDGQGSTFVVRLPLVDEKPASSGKPRSRTDLPTGRTGPSVLVVDDNDAAAAGVGRLLEMQGCSLSYAYSGGQALEHMNEATPEVILLDIGLQDQDGYTVAKKLRTRGYGGLLIALTGYSTPDARQKGQAAGFDHYLVKPVSMAELRKVIPRI